MLIKPGSVAKMRGAWRVYIDFTDLNKAISKKPYPLPRIDQLGGFSSGHELLSFLDVYKGYHQILMAEEDIAKTALITDDGIYFFTRMPFSFKGCWRVFPGGHEQGL